jgi:hypothetical protein
MAFADLKMAEAVVKQATVRARRRRQAKTGTTHVLISPMRLVISATSPRSPHHFDGSEKPSGSGGGKPLAVASLVVSATIASTSLASVSASDCSGDGGSRQAAARARARRSSDSAMTRARERRTDGLDAPSGTRSCGRRPPTRRPPASGRLASGRRPGSATWRSGSPACTCPTPRPSSASRPARCATGRIRPSGWVSKRQSQRQSRQIRGAWAVQRGLVARADAAGLKPQRQQRTASRRSSSSLRRHPPAPPIARPRRVK